MGEVILGKADTSLVDKGSAEAAEHQGDEAETTGRRYELSHQKECPVSSPGV